MSVCDASCKPCIYSSVMSTWSVSCNYILVTGNRRERSAKNCAARCRGRQQVALRAYLERQGITAKALSQKIGVSPGTVHRWMREVCLADWGKLAAVGCAKPEGL